MTKQKAPLPEGKLEEAANAVGLHKIHEEEFFKTPAKSTEFDDLCNGIDIKVGSKHKEAKELCINLVHRLEKLSKDNPPKHNEYCSYLRYWLYEKIGEIHEDKSANVDKVPFFKHLIEAWGKMNSGKLQSKCLPDKLTTPVKLSELKNRIFSYIYFKNLEKIKTISTSENQDNCTKFLTYLESFKLVHDKYKSAQCGIFSWSSYDTDYFFCNPKYKLVPLISELQKCKKGDKPDPKTALPSQAGAKGDSGAAPAKDQKVSGGTTQLKAPVAVASSSSSSTTVTTSPTITNFYKYIEHKRFGKAGDYNKCTKYKRFAGYSNHKYTKCRRFNKFNRSKTLYDKLDSNTVKNIIMAAAVLGIIFFLFYYNRSSRIESSIKPKKRKKKAFEHNYYEEYEKELARYESDNESLDSLDDRYYLTYQPEGDSHY
ncbi:Plasmodium vivax Vir protein, putative [Plasmodium vivax]|uniref:Vir protein, putative n=1 Tax=Plasmodium vivax TaxID=5855 RepID=A0A1G4EBD2_PLAVI|nr:Plasmodium vivax Vir protein, putative [Plasmodium vivax]